MSRTRFAAMVAVCLAFLAVGAGQALASGGSGGGGSGGGGGGGGTPPPPAGAPAISFSPSSVTYATQQVGTISAPQTVTFTNTGTAPLFINGERQGGIDPLDFGESNDQCVGTFVAVGSSCTIQVDFRPTATGTRTATISVIDNAANSPQVITFSGTATSPNGPTPLSVDTTGLSCSSGVCQLGFPGDQLVRNFYFTTFGAVGDTAPPFTWALVDGALPPGLTLLPNGQMYGTPTATGTFTFTVKVTDPNGQTATQAFSLAISPQPPPLTPQQQQCQHAPSSTTANLTGPAIGGKVPSGQGLGDQSQLTACGGFTVIHVSVKNVNLPNGTVLWVTLGGGQAIGRIVLNGGSATMAPWTLAISSLRKQSIQIYSQPPSGNSLRSPVLSGPFV
jgi:hypothetical protein